MLLKVTNAATASPNTENLDRKNNIFDSLSTKVDSEGKIVFVEVEEAEKQEQFTDKLTAKFGAEESALR